MAGPGSLKVGDVVTHPDWPNGAHRKVVAIAPMKYHPKMPKPKFKEFVVTLDYTVFAKGESTVGLSKAELALNKQWMEAGLLKVE